jgi:hypothetical protein
VIRIKGKAVVYGEVWFDEEVPARPGVDVVVYRQRQAPIPGVPHKPFLTMVSDLAVAEDEINKPFDNTCRYQIRRADGKDGLQAEFITEPAGRLDEFCEYFDAFARQKSIEPASREYLEGMCAAGQLVLTLARRGDSVLAWHAYLRSGAVSWLEHTASSFREGDNEHRALVGRANRWLHWRDMLAFRANGVTCYDWGGMFEDESTAERAGINNFKRSFGGRIEHRCEYSLPVSLRGRLFLPLRDAWRRWKTPVQPTTAAAAA